MTNEMSSTVAIPVPSQMQLPSQSMEEVHTSKKRKAYIPESKHRFFTFLIYPDSAPEDWVTRIESIGQPIAISPWHDKDRAEGIDPQTGQPREGFKKVHAHCLYVASNPVTASSVRKKLQRALKKTEAVGLVQIVDNIEGAYLYLTHESKDAIAKGKHVYDKKDLRHLNGFDIDRYVTMDLEQKKEVLDIIVKAIRTHYIANALQLYDFVDREGERYGLKAKDVTEVAKANSGFLNMFFTGAYQEAQRTGSFTYGDLKDKEKPLTKEEIEAYKEEAEFLEFLNEKLELEEKRDGK